MSELRCKVIACPGCKGRGTVDVWNGAYLRQRRKQYSLTLKAVAGVVGISVPMLYYIETGRYRARERFGEIERAIHALKR